MNVFHENLKTPKLILGEICRTNGHKLTYSEAKEALDELIALQSFPNLDDTLTIESAVYRLIREEVIDKVFAADIQSSLEETYGVQDIIDPDKVPSWLAAHIVIDWEGVVKAVRMSGYGTQLSTYDNSELFESGIFVFRTN